MTLTYDASVATVPQSGNWQCSAASAAWLLEALGIGASQDDVVAALGPGRIDPSVGLHDHTGAGLVAMLAESFGVQASNGGVSFDDAVRLASSGPLLLGGDSWDHWTGVRGTDGTLLQLANPSAGWHGVGQTMSRDQFAQQGPFFAVWPSDVAPSDGGNGPSAAPAVAGAGAGDVGGVSLPSGLELAAGAFALLWALDLLP